MGNNLVGVNLEVDKDYLQDAVRQTVLMGISEALNGKNEIVSQIVNSVLKTRVNRYGNISSYDSDPTLLEHYVKEMLTDVAKEEMKKMVEEKREEVSKIIRKELAKNKNLEKFTNGFIDSFTKGLESTWKTNINIEFKKVSDE